MFLDICTKTLSILHNVIQLNSAIVVCHGSLLMRTLQGRQQMGEYERLNCDSLKQIYWDGLPKPRMVYCTILNPTTKAHVCIVELRGDTCCIRSPWFIAVGMVSYYHIHVFSYSTHPSFIYCFIMYNQVIYFSTTNCI